MRLLPVLAALWATFALAQSDPQQLLQKAQSGEKLSPEETQQLRDYYLGQAMKAQPGLSPDQQQLLDKRKRGESLSSDDVQNLKNSYLQRANEKLGQGNAMGAKGFAMLGSLEAATPKENPAAHVEQRVALDPGSYLALVKQIQTEASQAAGPNRSSKLLVAAKGKTANNLGVLLTFAPDGPAPSALVLAAAALANPKSSLIASNLSVAVYNANFFERAYDLATWADKLKPGDASITANRAWPAMYLGDFKSAEKLFNQALTLDPKLADAHTGLALLAKGRGDTQMMGRQGRKAAEDGAGGFVDTVLAQEGRHGLSDDQRAELTPLVDEQGPASVGGVIYDNTAGAGFSYPVWTIDPEPLHAAAMIPIYAQALEQEGARLRAISQERTQKSNAYAQAQAARAGATADGVSYPRRNPRILVLLDDLQGIYAARALKAQKEIDKALPLVIKNATQVAAQLAEQEGQALRPCKDERCKKKVENEFCLKRHAQARELHGAAGEAYGKAVAKQRDLMTEFWKKSDPLVNGISNPDLQQARELDRRVMLYGTLTSSRTMVSAWLSAVGGLAAGECVPAPPPPSPEETAAAQKDPATPDPKPGKCIPPPGSFGVGAVNASWDCSGFKIQGGEGLFGGVQVKFAGADGKGTLSGHTETTVFAGVGFEESAGRASGSAQAVIGFTQSQGQVVDVSAGMSTEAKIEGFGAKASTGTDLTWSSRSGANMSWGAEASFRGQSLGSAGDPR